MVAAVVVDSVAVAAVVVDSTAVAVADTTATTATVVVDSTADTNSPLQSRQFKCPALGSDIFIFNQSRFLHSVT